MESGLKTGASFHMLDYPQASSVSAAGARFCLRTSFTHLELNVATNKNAGKKFQLAGYERNAN